ncbi:hypothetical protein LJB91_04115 [Bacteroidales bacterium OttesenSCG-928-L03]|nr:hypothetical protein [Bacteroidales bacterium OttesenSCG-928-L03]
MNTLFRLLIIYLGLLLPCAGNAQTNTQSRIDWNQGYGYQMWRSLHNAYRADGARGQEIIVFPDHDLVVICTAQFSDLGKAFRMIYDTLLPGMN